MALSKGKIYKYNLKGDFICEYESLEAAADIDNISSSYIGHHINGYSSYCHKHIYTREYYIKLPLHLLEHKTKRIFKTKEIHQYSMDGKYIKSYKDSNDAAKETGFIKRYIRDCAAGNLGKGKSYRGFLWSFEKKKEIPKFEKKLPFKQVHQYSLDGDYIKTYNSIKEASEKLNINKNSISSCISHDNTPSSGGFIWSLIKLKKIKSVKPKKTPINVYLNNKFYKTFESQAEACRVMKFPRSVIYEYLSGKRKSSYKGYTFKDKK